MSELFTIFCTAECRKETIALKVYPRRYKTRQVAIWRNRCLACGTLYDALPPMEEDGERGSEVPDLAS